MRKSAINRARGRLGVVPLELLFWHLARPFPGPGTPGAWYCERRLVSLEGTTIDPTPRSWMRALAAATAADRRPPRPASSPSCAASDPAAL